jgi:hypothetical protein
MPIYLYKHPATGEIIEILQGMNDEHIYFEDGVEFDRVFTIPQASIDTQIDPMSSMDFVEKTGRKKGSIGDLWDASKELSSKRTDKIGKDPIQEKAFDDYSKKRRGRKSLEETRSKAPKEIFI